LTRTPFASFTRMRGIYHDDSGSGISSFVRFECASVTPLHGIG
jgi:hypothetical protein